MPTTPHPLLGRQAIKTDFPSVERMASEIGAVIGASLPPGYGFALLVFSFGGDGFLTHISNADRGDLVKLVREYADKLEASLDVPPGVLGQKD